MAWDFVIQGYPATGQSSGQHKQRWKAQVAKAAKSGRPSQLPEFRSVALRVLVFHLARQGDIDNILKATLDGMKGVVFLDDEQVTQVFGAKIDLSNEPVVFRNPSEALAEAVGRRRDFVYVVVDDPQPLEELT